MRYFFYNSFTLGSGYKYAELKNNVICSTDIPVDIDCDFSNGGCQLVVRKTKVRTSILVLKGILYVNSEKRFDEQGRKVYINFAIEASSDELSSLNNAFFAIIAEWKNVCRYMGEAVRIPYPNNTYGYGIDQNQIDNLVHYLSTYDTDALRKKVGTDPNSSNAIVLKSSNYSYYESLAKDLYKSKRQSFSGRFVPENIISGETFTRLTENSSVQDYDEFLQKVSCPIQDDTDMEQDNSIQPETKSETKPETAEEPTQVHETVPAPREEPQSQNQTTDLSNQQPVHPIRITPLKGDEPDSGFTHACKTIYHRLIKPHSKFILGLVCGLIIGYLIWNK